MRTTAFLLTSLLLCTSVSADLITPQTSAPRILVPAAGNAQGANGTYFRSDIQIANLRNVEQRVLMYWLPQGSSGAAVLARAIDLGPERGFSSEDFVTTAMAQTGVGAIEFVAANENGVFDPAGQLQVTSRIWTPRPDGAAGSMSQSFPSIVLHGTSEPREKAIFGLRYREQFRVNAGIANPGTTVQRFRVNALIRTSNVEESVVVEVEVQPRSIEQRTFGFDNAGVVQIEIENLTDGAVSEWHAWGSTVDNFSGDAWSQMAFPQP